MKTDAEFEIVVHGATGFTGRLVAEHLARNYASQGLRWAMSGRDAAKLAAVRAEIGASADTPLIVADSDDSTALAAMAVRTDAVISTVGPFQLHGEPLVAACVAAGTDYLDLSAEPAWMKRMIGTYDEAARKSGARILFSCGFDSIPFELGVLLLQMAAEESTGAPVSRVKARVMQMQGSFSGGTIASLRANSTAALADPDVAAVLDDPFALTPGYVGPDQPAGDQPEIDDDLGIWVTPFVMAAINTRNLHRANYLMGHRYGKDFTYDEMMAAGPGPEGEAMAKAIMAAMFGMGGEDGPKPGEGPSKAERDAGSYELLFQGRMIDGRMVRSVVKGDRDPGYGSTSKMIAETALCILDDRDTPGGVWTPSAALGSRLIERLTAYAGLSFAADVA